MEKEMFDALVAKMKIVLKLLGFEIDKSREEDRYNPTVWGKKGNAEIFLTSGGYKLDGKIRISGIYPRSKKGEYLGSFLRDENGVTINSGVSITVTTSKSAEKIAKEIQARFMPDYEKALVAVLKVKEDFDGYAERKAAGVKKLAKIMNETPGIAQLESGKMSCYGDRDVSFEVFSEDAKIEFRLPIEKAAEALEVLVKAGLV